MLQRDYLASFSFFGTLQILFETLVRRKFSNPSRPFDVMSLLVDRPPGTPALQTGERYIITARGSFVVAITKNANIPISLSLLARINQRLSSTTRRRRRRSRKRKRNLGAHCVFYT